MTEPISDEELAALADEELERIRRGIQPSKSRAARRGTLGEMRLRPATVEMLITRIDLERNRADEAERFASERIIELSSQRNAAEAECERLRAVLRETRIEIQGMEICSNGRHHAPVSRALVTIDLALL